MAMDESGFKLNESPRYGYSKKGTPSTSSKPNCFSANYSLLLAIRWTPPCSQNEPPTTDATVQEALSRAASVLLSPPPVSRSPVVSWALTKSSVNAVRFQNYMQNGIAPGARRADGTETVLALDNARIHHATKACVDSGLPTIAETARQNRIRLLYLPPYCPFLNPAEHAFKVIKNDFVRPARPRTEADLVAAIQRGLLSLTSEKVNRMFEHCFIRSRMPTLTSI